MKKKLFVMIIIVVMLSGLTPVQAIIPGEDAYQPGMEITSTGVLYSDILDNFWTKVDGELAGSHYSTTYFAVDPVG